MIASGRHVPQTEGSAPIPFRERELFILERAADGSWHETHVDWNEDVSARATGPARMTP